jgi:hypothetical protein
VVYIRLTMPVSAAGDNEKGAAANRDPFPSGLALSGYR